MDMRLRKADGHHENAVAIYKKIVQAEIDKAGSIEKAAENCGMPSTTLRDALKRGSYLAIRNCAHKIVKAVKS